MKPLPRNQRRFQLLNDTPAAGMVKMGDRRAAHFLQILLADAQLGNDGTIAVDVLLCQIVQQAAALADHHQKAAAGMVVVLVRADAR